MEAPIVCALPTAERRAQLERWSAFATRHERSRRSEPGRLIVRYGGQDALRGLTELVEIERRCCAFVEWSIESDAEEVRLVVSGSATGLAAVSLPDRDQPSVTAARPPRRRDRL